MAERASPGGAMGAPQEAARYLPPQGGAVPGRSGTPPRLPRLARGAAAEGRWGVTEVEWAGCAEPGPMLEFLRGKATGRKLRLFACACARRHWAAMAGASRRAVEVAER